MKIIEFRNRMYKHDNIWYYIKLSDKYEVGVYNVKVKKDMLRDHLLFWQLINTNSFSMSYTSSDLSKIKTLVSGETWDLAC